MFCQHCGSKIVNGDCNSCFSNPNALRDFECEDD